MNTADAVIEYLRLTDEIKILKDARNKLKPFFKEGRNIGPDRDVRMTRSSKTRLDMWELRRWVTAEVLDRCRTFSIYVSVSVVPKPKPPKEKKK